jgi:tRNA A-37 threonylcarbamoyl transferase component Bud32
MNEFISNEWLKVFQHNDLNGFDDFWKAEADWFEPPNYRRGGWSGASRMVLADPEGGERVIFLKRQENHTRKIWRRPLSKEPTFRGEARNLQFLNKHQIAAPELVYYAEFKSPKGWQVVLATRELTGFVPLDILVESWKTRGWEKFSGQRKQIIPRAAALIRRLHQFNMVHGALHAKHIFVQPDTAEVCLIDLEKMRRRMFRRHAMVRDLDTCNRRTFFISHADRLRFFKEYLQIEELDDDARALWYRLAALEKTKNARL